MIIKKLTDVQPTVILLWSELLANINTKILCFILRDISAKT